MTTMEMTEKVTEVLPGDREIKLKLQVRTTEELIGFQRKLRSPRYSHNPQAMSIRFHLIQELLTRHLMGEEV